ncbi:MAG: HIT family protein [Deltaproteobacteria bacterium]|nr:HIT family protein [Deltaproteobacteria bacterium]
MGSPFLSASPERWVASNDLAFALRDNFPVSPGHTLVVPRREVATWFDATREEQVAILELVDAVKAQLDAELQPAGYNVGFNAGVAAGQTVMHLHVHVIPRFTGDVEDPRGGVRHVMPGKGSYLKTGVPPSTDFGCQAPSSHVGSIPERARGGPRPARFCVRQRCRFADKSTAEARAC